MADRPALLAERVRKLFRIGGFAELGLFICVLLAGGRTRPTTIAHSRGNTKTWQDPGLERKPEYDKPEDDQDFHF